MEGSGFQILPDPDTRDKPVKRSLLDDLKPKTPSRQVKVLSKRSHNIIATGLRPLPTRYRPPPMTGPFPTSSLRSTLPSTVSSPSKGPAPPRDNHYKTPKAFGFIYPPMQDRESMHSYPTDATPALDMLHSDTQSVPSSPVGPAPGMLILPAEGPIQQRTVSADVVMESAEASALQTEALHQVTPARKRGRPSQASLSTVSKRQRADAIILDAKATTPKPPPPPRYTAEQELWLGKFIATNYPKGEKKSWNLIAEKFEERFGQKRTPGALSVKYQLRLNMDKDFDEPARVEAADNIATTWTDERSAFLLMHGDKMFSNVGGAERDWNGVANAVNAKFGSEFDGNDVKRHYISLQEREHLTRRITNERRQRGAPATENIEESPPLIDNKEIWRRRYSQGQKEWLVTRLGRDITREGIDWSGIRKEFKATFDESRAESSLERRWKLSIYDGRELSEDIAISGDVSQAMSEVVSDNSVAALSPSVHAPHTVSKGTQTDW